MRAGGLGWVGSGVMALYGASLSACVPLVNGTFACTSDSDCAFGNRCSPVDHTCVTAPRGIRGAGEPCAFDVDCEGWACLQAWPSGYCTAECRVDAECGAGTHCGTVGGGGQPYCVLDCSDDGACRGPDYGCIDVDNDSRRECHPLASGTGVVGDPCVWITDCSGGGLGRCLDTWPEGGMCVRYGCPNLPCPGGSHCVWASQPGSGVCQPDCSDGSDCRGAGYDCYDYDLGGVLECAPIGSGARAVGGPCVGISDCGGGRYGLCATGSNYPNGYCIIGACGAATTCPTGSHCAFQNAGGGMCVQDCSSDADCRMPDYGCYDADLGVDATLECVSVGSGTSPIGGPCEYTSDCSGGAYVVCIPPASNVPGGYCSKHCGGAAGGCPAGSECEGTSNGVCLQSCDFQEDCRPGFACVAETDGPVVCDLSP